MTDTNTDTNTTIGVPTTDTTAGANDTDASDTNANAQQSQTTHTQATPIEDAIASVWVRTANGWQQHALAPGDDMSVFDPRGNHIAKVETNPNTDITDTDTTDE